MIKGVNHTIIELSDTGSEYYERAILIIKPVYASVQRAVLEQEARRMLKKMEAPSVLHSQKRWRPLLLTALAGILSGLLVGFFLH